MTETKKENEREIVLAILIEVLEKNQFSHIVIRQALDKYSYLPQKDRSFIARLSRGCVERKIELDAIIDKAASVKASKQKPVIRNILRMAGKEFEKAFFFKNGCLSAEIYECSRACSLQ